MSQPETKCWRNDAYAKVTGKAKFTDDLKFANVLHAAPAYSDFVHAKMKAIDTSAAEKFAGVIRVITAKDVPGVNRFGQIIRDFRIFAEPACSAVVAALKKLRGSKRLGRKEQVVLLITGHGLKDVESAMRNIQLPKAVEPTPAGVESALEARAKKGAR